MKKILYSFVLFVMISCKENQQIINKNNDSEIDTKLLGTNSNESKKDDTLVLSYQNLKSIPIIENIEKIRYLDLSNNNIKSFDFMTLLIDSNGQLKPSNLECLNLSYNQIDSGFFLYKSNWFPKLKKLDLSNNQIPAFFTAGIDTLESLDLSNNQIAYFRTGMYFDSLNISNNVNLTGEQQVDVDRINHLISYGIDLSKIEFKKQKSKIVIEVDESMEEKVNNDSLQLLYYLKMTSCFEDSVICETLSIEEIEKINASNGSLHWISERDCSIHYSSDSLLKIFELTFENGGILGNTDKKHYIHFISLNKTIKSEIILQNVIEIHKLPDGKYLITHSGGGLVNSSRAETKYIATLLSFENDSINYHTIPKPKFNIGVSHFHQNKNKELYLIQGRVGNNNPFIHYDIDAKVLSYNVGNDLVDCCQIDSAFIFEGSYKYLDGEFINQEENKTPTVVF